MKKITEFVGLLSLQVEALRDALRPTAPKSTTLPASALRILMPLDKLWLEATQLSLPLESVSPMYSKVCLDQHLYQLEELRWLWLTGQASKLESILGCPILAPDPRSYYSLHEARTSIKLMPPEPFTSKLVKSQVNNGKLAKSKS